jgi:predicted small metal-binding protein
MALSTEEGLTMTQVIQCPCGTTLRAASLEEVIAQAQTHAKEVHQLELTKDEAQAMARTE